MLRYLRSAFKRAIPILVFCAAVATAAAQNPRSHTRLNPRGTRVTDSQAETVTLTLQTWSGDKIQRETFFYDPAQMRG